ncbi:Dihydroorotate dehydrogenase B (NAD(+)), catalytic subunit [invertebrate metagenome]|uniref:Dihydroorotate dehydrogenase B (NAD(+)), catalytic subunit n=1 Tax=invertebrate metagenome TaxID=1711999 RepID=A0A2H9TAF1_9ZZZZ
MRTVDLTTCYMGLSLSNPLVAAAGPLSFTVKSVERLKQAGIGAIVLHSLFEEQLSQVSLPPSSPVFSTTTDAYMETIHTLKQTVDIPVIASLNGCTAGNWIDFSKELETAGADAVELHVCYLPVSSEISGQTVEQRYLSMAKRIHQQVSVPVSMKIDPFFSAFSHMAKQLNDVGINGLTLFNRLLQPDFDIDALDIELKWPISRPGDTGIPLHWISVLCDQFEGALAATGGAHGHEDVIKYLLAGADVVMLGSALIENGVGYLETLLLGIRRWMMRHDFESVTDMRGMMSRQSLNHNEQTERINYIRMLDGLDK